MSKPNKIASEIKDLPVLERPTSKGGQAKPSVLYLLELRSHHAEAASPVPKRKLAIATDPRDAADAIPKSIKIHHA